MVSFTSFFVSFVACTSFAQAKRGLLLPRQNNASLDGAIYRDPTASPEARVADLLPRMNLQEKIGQLMQGDVSNWLDTTNGTFNYTGLVANMQYKAGSFYVGYPISWDWLARGIKYGQDYLMNNTRLGIPAFVQTEGIHGFLIGNATIFNSPIAYGCSFNPDLIEKMGKTIGTEAAALGVSQLFAPLSDLARELRYGRVEETNSEDPYLAGEISYSYIKGLQSTNVSATVKHYVGFSAPEGGLNTAPVHGGERELRTTWMPPFKRAIVDAGAWSIMSAYHSYDGIPAITDHHTLTDILRGEWGYQSWVTSDAGATDRVADAFHVCAHGDMSCITQKCITAGNDVEMGGGSFNYRSIANLTASGQLDMDVVDTAVGRLLWAKFASGLFDNPYPAVPAYQRNSTIHTPANVDLARQIDRESIVLLENHKQTLPISKDKKVAVIGPMAYGFMNYGDYVVKDSYMHGVTPLDGIRSAIGNGSVIYAQGCERWSNDQSGFPEAVAAAQSADVAVVVVGTWSRDQFYLWQGLNATTGEHVDVSSLNLVGAQAPLVKAIADTGKPTVVVFSSGKPITETWIANYTSALVQQFYPSEQGGNALADILFGDYTPSGKLSVSFPRDVGTMPSYYDYLNSGRPVDPGMMTSNGSLVFGHQYVLNNPTPWYEFGYGKSYTTFQYSNVSLSARNVSASGTLTASVTVSNTGNYDGQEVVQMYVQDMVSSVTVPNKQLKGFQKVMIKKGSSQTVSIPVNVADLGLWDVDMKYVVEPGDFAVWMGSSSTDLRGNATFTVS
ncbi:MAG: hypothetical protein Q9227_000690 [Pyrenula ochraceoflavens]